MLQPLAGTLFRIVESQEEAATVKIVSDLDKQMLLEQMLEQYSKPEPPDPASKLSYLLSTPFRYPPLAYGSRFGDIDQPSLFYGAMHESTVMAECAFYRLVFWHHMQTPPPEPITVRHTLFCADYASDAGVDLSQPPFAAQLDKICHIRDYAYSQQLGSYLREAHVKVLWAPSVRDPEHKLNIALFDAEPFTVRAPTSTAEWFSSVDGQSVIFKKVRELGVYRFERRQFEDEKGALPKLA